MEITREELRECTMSSLLLEQAIIFDNYMKIYDKYYDTNNRDCLFLKELTDIDLYLSALLKVYVEQGKLYSDYVEEKCNHIISLATSCKKHFKAMEERRNNENEH